MSAQEKNERNKKRRKSYQLKRAQQTIDACSKGDDQGLNCENQQPNNNDDWLHTNMSSQPPNMPHEDISNQLSAATVDQNRSITTPKAIDAIERKRARERSRYAAMSVDQRRMLNSTPARKESRKRYKTRQKEMLHNTLNKDSIAIENPNYIRQAMMPTETTKPPHGSSVSSRDMVIPDLSPSPCLILPASTQTVEEEAQTSDMHLARLRPKRRVPSGERHTLIACRNQQFQATIARNLATTTDESEGREGNNDTQTQTAAEDIDGETPGHCPAIEDRKSMAREEDSMTQPQTASEVINDESTCPCPCPSISNEARIVVSDNEDDEDVIFEEDEDEEEGYLFAGQEEYTNEEIEIDGTQDDSNAIPDVSDPYDKVYCNIPDETHKLKPVPNCGHCSMKKFEYEPPGFCCRSGKIHLSTPRTSDELVRLWSSAGPDARHFRDNIRFFNGHFSFTSLYYCLDSVTTNMSDRGITHFVHMA